MLKNLHLPPTLFSTYISYSHILSIEFILMEKGIGLSNQVKSLIINISIGTAIFKNAKLRLII